MISSQWHHLDNKSGGNMFLVWWKHINKSQINVTCVKYLRWVLFFTVDEALCSSEIHREFSCFNLEKKDGFIWSQWRQITHHSISDGKEVLLHHFQFHLLLICIYSYINTNGGGGHSELAKYHLFIKSDSTGGDGWCLNSLMQSLIQGFYLLQMNSGLLFDMIRW